MDGDMKNHDCSKDELAPHGKVAPADGVVIVVDGYSTGRFYADELRSRGFRPCHLTSGVEDEPPSGLSHKSSGIRRLAGIKVMQVWNGKFDEFGKDAPDMILLGMRG